MLSKRVHRVWCALRCTLPSKYFPALNIWLHYRNFTMSILDLRDKPFLCSSLAFSLRCQHASKWCLLSVWNPTTTHLSKNTTRGVGSEKSCSFSETNKLSSTSASCRDWLAVWRWNSGKLLNFSFKLFLFYNIHALSWPNRLHLGWWFVGLGGITVYLFIPIYFYTRYRILKYRLYRAGI